MEKLAVSKQSVLELVKHLKGRANAVKVPFLVFSGSMKQCLNKWFFIVSSVHVHKVTIYIPADAILLIDS